VPPFCACKDNPPLDRTVRNLARQRHPLISRRWNYKGVVGADKVVWNWLQALVSAFFCPLQSRSTGNLPLRPLHLSNATSEPLSGSQLYSKLIGEWGAGGMRSSRRTKTANEGRDWYSWLLPSLCLMLLTVLLWKH
jgi:hypothetical protein